MAGLVDFVRYAIFKVRVRADSARILGSFWVRFFGLQIQILGSFRNLGVRIRALVGLVVGYFLLVEHGSFDVRLVACEDAEPVVHSYVVRPWLSVPLARLLRARIFTGPKSVTAS